MLKFDHNMYTKFQYQITVTIIVIVIVTATLPHFSPDQSRLRVSL